jgi:hypothetical protein
MMQHERTFTNPYMSNTLTEICMISVGAFPSVSIN